MTTTIELPDELVEQARRVAKQEGVTLRGLFEEGLQRSLKARRQAVRRQLSQLDFPSVGGSGLTEEFQGEPWSRIRDEIYRERGASRISHRPARLQPWRAISFLECESRRATPPAPQATSPVTQSERQRARPFGFLHRPTALTGERFLSVQTGELQSSVRANRRHSARTTRPRFAHGSRCPRKRFRWRSRSTG